MSELQIFPAFCRRGSRRAVFETRIFAATLDLACGAQDAMETAAQSEDKDIAEELLRFFVDSGEKECFAALLFTCYDLIKPDVALEVSTASCTVSRLSVAAGLLFLLSRDQDVDSCRAACLPRHVHVKRPVFWFSNQRMQVQRHWHTPCIDGAKAS